MGDDRISPGDNWIACRMSVASSSLQGFHFDVERSSLVCQSASTSEHVECLSGIKGVLAFLSLKHEKRQLRPFLGPNSLCLNVLINSNNAERQKRHGQNDYQNEIH